MGVQQHEHQSCCWWQRGGSAPRDTLLTPSCILLPCSTQRSKFNCFEIRALKLDRAGSHECAHPLHRALSFLSSLSLLVSYTQHRVCSPLTHSKANRRVQPLLTSPSPSKELVQDAGHIWIYQPDASPPWHVSSSAENHSLPLTPNLVNTGKRRVLPLQEKASNYLLSRIFLTFPQDWSNCPFCCFVSHFSVFFSTFLVMRRQVPKNTSWCTFFGDGNLGHLSL